MRAKKVLSSLLALALVLNTGIVQAQAAGYGEDNPEQVQGTSAPETVYINSYDGGERSVSFNDHWRFYLGELNGAEAAGYNDSAWEDVKLPHDYSIDQGFSTAAPAEQESGYVLGGTGWYRKTFTLSEDTKGKTVSVDFDGVYMNATIYLNGVKLGTHPYGYTPFSFVLPAEQLKYGGEDNVLAVKVEHKQPSSRWYSGSGIYRDVNLTITNPVHVAYYGTTVTTPDIADGKGTVSVKASIQNDSGEDASVSILQKVYELDGTEPVATGEKTEAQTVAAGAEADITGTVTVPEPKLWSTDAPNMYTVRTEVYVGDALVDSYDSDFGFRWVTFTKDNGFFLNGKNMKLKGVSMHHDQGGLGSEAWYRAVERQVEKLQQMGVNAIRVTHNPASQVLIDICNRKGMMLVEEAFDCWLSGKAGNTEDYGKWFSEPLEEDNQIVNGEGCEQWAEFDVKAMVKRGRNAPSIVMWSLGNEVFQQLIDGSKNNQFPDTAKKLIKWVGEEDSTRYVTFGDNQVKSNVWANNAQVNTALVFASASDYGDVPGGLVGFNYGSSGQIQNGYSRNWMVYGSETASSINSRGVYDRKNNGGDGGRGDKRLTSYDKSRVGWGHLASDGLWITMRQPFNAGEFVWTGFDYIGEPTPDNWQGTGANGTWPNIAKNSYFGIIDTAGFPKDSFYLYQSQWNDKLHTLHVLPVWNRDEIVVGSDGKVEVVVYSDAPVVKLYLNDEEVGTATAVHTDTPTGGYQNYTSGTGCFTKVDSGSSASLYATFQVPYEEGKLEAKAFEADGVTPITDTDGRSVVETTKNANRLAMSADREEITADGEDLSYITIDVTDADGKFVNSAEPEITVSVEGDGKLLALDNGVQNDVTTYSEPARKAGKGKLLAIVQSTEEEGSFTVTASAPGYASVTETVATKADDSASQERSVVSYVISRNYFVKQGGTPTLPKNVTVNYTDGTSEEKAVTWDAIPEGQESYSVYGTIDDLNLRISVNVTVIGDVAGILNYSAAIGKDAELVLPSTRPAVIADGTVLTAEFPVTWEIPADITATEGTKKIQGTAAVFDQSFPVTASVRVTSGGYKDGDEALSNVPEMYINGVSSRDDDSIAEVLDKLRDDKTEKTDAAWSGRGTLDFRLDTAIELKNFTVYLKDTAPVSGTMKVYSSSDNGANWNLADCQVTNRAADGVTIRTFTPKNTVSETWFRVEFTKNVTVTELEMNTRIPTFTVGGEASLSSLKAGSRIADAATLQKGWFGVPEADLNAADITAVGKDNASVTFLPKDSENVVRILLESEDHSVRGIYKVLLGQTNTRNDNAADASGDYPYGDMTLSAPSVESGGSAANANDNKSNTIWHSNWGGGTGPTNLTNDPENRYLQIELKDTEKICALRYLPRSSDRNGIVTAYRIEVSTDGETWTNVSEGDGWGLAVEWKLAQFKEAVDAKYIRLYGVKTAGNDGKLDLNQYMSAAEVRVRYAMKEIYSGNTSVTFTKQAVDYTGQEITPKPVVTFTEGEEKITLTEGTDYELSYRNNREPGTAVAVVTGKGKYSGVVEAEFTINAVETTVTGYDSVAVTTGKGEYPGLPGTVTASTNIGQQTMEVRWDTVSSSMLNTYGTFTVYGTVTDTKARVVAQVTVSDVIGVQQVTLATGKGMEPSLPEQVTVYYSNGDVAKRDVEWDLSGLDFEETGIVRVTGRTGKAEAVATVRVEEVQADANNTPVGKNLALNENGVSASQEWPRTFAYISASGDPAHHATDGKKDFVSDSSKVIWSDWESGQYHTNAGAAVGAADHLPFVATAFGVDGSTANEDQKKYTVNKISVGFMEEDGSSANKVRLPKDYKIEYYSGNSGVIPANRLVNGSASECSNTKGWGSDNPIKAHDGWTEVTYVGGKPSVPSLDDFKHMVDIEIEPVETTAIRITLTPQDNNWTGLEEFEVYYEPVEEKSTYQVTDITLDGESVLGQFDEETKTLEVQAKEGKIAAEASDNASVTVLDAVDGTAKIIFLPENGDASGRQEYTVKFQTQDTGESYQVSAESDLVDLGQGTFAAGAQAAFQAKAGYAFESAPILVKSEDGTETGIEVTGQDGVYTFQMPEYPVTVQGELVPVTYKITYNLDGGEAENPAEYTVETPEFTLKNPVKAGYIFVGWTGGLVTEPTKDITVAAGSVGNLTFTAHWRSGTAYTITFDSTGGTQVNEQKVPVDTGIITEPEAPAKRGYTFAGWYIDAEGTAAWNFDTDKAEDDMTLYAKWTEAEITINTKIPAYLFGESFEMPDVINVTAAGESFDTAVTWRSEDIETVKNAAELGSYTVTGTLGALEDREVSATVIASPANIVYFVDCGASAFTEKGQMLMDANAGTVKNEVPDQAYDSQKGWGYTNDTADLETNGSGDAYATIRNFKANVNGATLSYQFALEPGTYNVTAGFYDPWSQWAGDNRHARVYLADAKGETLAEKADHHISAKEDVEFKNIVLEEAGNVTLHIAPLKTGSNSDTMISFIVISKKADYSKAKEALKGAVNIAQALRAEDYTEESYAVLESALKEAQTVYDSEDADWQEIRTQMDKLLDAVKNLVSAKGEENKNLEEQLAEKEQALKDAQTRLTELQGELQEQKNAVSELQTSLQDEQARADRLQSEVTSLEQEVKDLEADVEELEKEAGDNEKLQQELDAKKQELADKNTELTEKTQELDTANERITDLTSQLKTAAEKAGELENSLLEEKNRTAALETELGELKKAYAAEKEALEKSEKELKEAKEALEKAQKEAAEAQEALKKIQSVRTLKKGDTVKKGGLLYRVTDEVKKEAEVYGVSNTRMTKATVAATVKINGVSCRVTGIADKTFAGLKKMRTVVIGKNVKTIGKKAFSGCKKLTRVNIKGKVLKKVGKQAFKGISAKAVIKVPKAKKQAYTRLFKGKGQKKTVKVK